MAEIILVDVSVEVNDQTIAVEGNTVVLNEGTGTVTVKAATQGGKPVMVVSEDVTSKVGMVKFDIPSTVNGLNASRDWAVFKKGASVVRVSGTDPAGNRMGRTLMQGTMTNDPDKAIQNDGKISIEFSGLPLVQS